MAKRRSNKRSSVTSKKTRVPVGSVNANRPARLRFRPSPPRSPIKDDRRRFQPTAPRLRLVSGPQVATVRGQRVSRQRPGGSFSRERVAFAAPRAVMVCVRRKRRREVLFASGRTGGGNRRPKWNERSHIACRR